MPSLAAYFMRIQLFLTKPIVRFAGIPASRKAQDQLGRLTQRALKEQVRYEDIRFERFEASFAQPRAGQAPDAGVILYLHGGGYTAGMLDYCKAFGGILSVACGLRTLCVAYRLAPEHRFPAALDDAMAAYDYLLEQGYAGRILVAGESAGGGLAFCLGLRLRDEDRPMPCGFIGISPWADLMFSGNSYSNNVRRDPSLCRESLAYYTLMYAAGREDEPYVSPVLGEFSGFPPVLLTVGSEEILFDDAKTLHARIREAGVPAELIVGKGLWHVYPLYGLPESRDAIRRMAKFIWERLDTSGNEA